MAVCILHCGYLFTRLLNIVSILLYFNNAIFVWMALASPFCGTFASLNVSVLLCRAWSRGNKGIGRQLFWLGIITTFWRLCYMKTDKSSKLKSKSVQKYSYLDDTILNFGAYATTSKLRQVSAAPHLTPPDLGLRICVPHSHVGLQPPASSKIYLPPSTIPSDAITLLLQNCMYCIIQKLLNHAAVSFMNWRTFLLWPWAVRRTVFVICFTLTMCCSVLMCALDSDRARRVVQQICQGCAWSSAEEQLEEPVAREETRSLCRYVRKERGSVQRGSCCIKPWPSRS